MRACPCGGKTIKFTSASEFVAEHAATFAEFCVECGFAWGVKDE